MKKGFLYSFLILTILFSNCQMKDDVAKYKKLYEKAEASVNAELEAQEKHALEENLRKKEEEKQGKEQEKKKQDEQAKREEQERKEKEEANKAEQAEKDKEQKDKEAAEQAKKDAEKKKQEEEAEKAKQEEKERKEKEDAEKAKKDAEKKKQEEEKQGKEQEGKDKEQKEKEEKLFIEEFNKLENPKKKNWVTLQFTGQGCPPCGKENPILINYKSNYKDNYIVVFLHCFSDYSPQLHTTEVDAYTNKFNIRGIPRSKPNTLGSYIEKRGLYDVIKTDAYIKRYAKVQRLNRKLEVKFTAEAINNNEFTFKAKKLKLVIWILESKIRAKQKIGGFQNNNFEHNYVFRSCLSKTFGDDFKLTDIYKNTFELPNLIKDENISNCELLFMLTDADTGQIYDGLEVKL